MSVVYFNSTATQASDPADALDAWQPRQVLGQLGQVRAAQRGHRVQRLAVGEEAAAQLAVREKASALANVAVLQTGRFGGEQAISWFRT